MTTTVQFKKSTWGEWKPAETVAGFVRLGQALGDGKADPGQVATALTATVFGKDSPAAQAAAAWWKASGAASPSAPSGAPAAGTSAAPAGASALPAQKAGDLAAGAAAAKAKAAPKPAAPSEADQTRPGKKTAPKPAAPSEADQTRPGKKTAPKPAAPSEADQTRPGGPAPAKASAKESAAGGKPSAKAGSAEGEPVGAKTFPGVPVDAKVKSAEGERSAKGYEKVIDQFQVDKNPRYQKNRQGKGETYCNVFANDVTKAMGAEIPHTYDDKTGEAGKGYQHNANGMVDWLHKHGEKKGWKKVSAEEAQAHANKGKPAVACFKNEQGGSGHFAVVRPGECDAEKGPAISQAGYNNIGKGHVKDGFGAGAMKKTEYWVHD